MSGTDSSVERLLEGIDSYNQKTFRRIKWVDEVSQGANEDIRYFDRIKKELEQAKQQFLESSGNQKYQMSNEEKKVKIKELSALIAAKTNEMNEQIALRERENAKKEIVK